MSIEEWYRFMNEMSSHEIVWRHEALNIPDMATNSAGFDRMGIPRAFQFHVLYPRLYPSSTRYEPRATLS
ncbi:hypothetical protein RHMOL_Rhmol02G0196300 [Rhododendron molle]|uniref:Uncharacterized protein n=1 Tax=Rhododendron molle TaxID=49168 RepID=A0ACC0PRN3_RHOML|nr:hypothetical protein RHMOL_Rhmol02G0196300 [Rhododendron molle]